MEDKKAKYSRLKELLKASEDEYVDEESAEFIDKIKDELKKNKPDLLAMQQESAKKGLSKLFLNRRQKRIVKAIGRHKK